MNGDGKDLTEDTLPIRANNAEAIAEAIVPIVDSENKSRYLSYRACGFNQREACAIVGVNTYTPTYWRKTDNNFREAEQKSIGELRQTMAREHITLEFTRNYALILRKDFFIIAKSLDWNKELTNKEHDYLLKARAHYTPQQLQILQQLFSKKEGEASLTFADIVLKLSETRREVIVGRF